MNESRPDIGCCCSTGCHADPRMEALHGPECTEWELVVHAPARYAGHRQPRTPLWGPRSEADPAAHPAAMAPKNDSAADHGIDNFVFDWYWYQNLPFLKTVRDLFGTRAATS